MLQNRRAVVSMVHWQLNRAEQVQARCFSSWHGCPQSGRPDRETGEKDDQSELVSSSELGNVLWPFHWLPEAPIEGRPYTSCRGS